MTKVAVVTDSVASIPKAVMEKLNIHFIPFYIHRGAETLRDLVTTTADTFYEWMMSAEQGTREIISIQVSSKVSGAVGAANNARKMLAEKFPQVRVEVIDSLSGLMCQGWMAVEAARAAQKGLSLNEISEQVRRMIPVSRLLQTADTLKYLYMGGRIGRAKHLVGSMLDIKPIISMQDGEIVALGQARTRKKVYQQMVDKLGSFVGQSAVKIAYMHANARDEAEKLKALVEQRVEVIESMICELSPVLGVHSGPGTVGFCFFPVPETVEK